MGPRISWIFPEAAPIATQKATRPPRTAQRALLGPTKAPWGTQGTPKESQRPQKRDPGDPKGVPKTPKKAPKGPPNEPQATPSAALGSPNAPKRHLKRHPKVPTLEKKKSMRPPASQQLHRRNFQTALLRKRSRPGGMRGALESAAPRRGSRA